MKNQDSGKTLVHSLEVKYWVLFGIAALVVALDQVLKVFVHTHFELGESISVIPGFFNLTYVRNPGAAFGFLANAQPLFREIFFLSIPPIALCIILAMLRDVSSSDRWRVLALSSVFGGAIGNYIDRLQFRYVIDFLDFHWGDFYSYPAFNVADMAIVGGVGVLTLLMARDSWKRQRDRMQVLQTQGQRGSERKKV